MVDWNEGVAAGDGRIFCIPDTASSILCIDPVNRTAEEFGDVGHGVHKWSGGVLAGDGKIYCTPWNHSKVLCIDPESQEVSFIEPITRSGGAELGVEHKWRGGVLAADGRIYCTPWAAETVLCIDPDGGIAWTFGELSEGEGKWAGSVLADDGSIYCIPYNAATVLRIAPGDSAMTGTVSHLGNLGDRARKWRGGVLAQDGCIYGVPYNSLQVLCISPEDGEVSQFGMVGGIRCKWRGGVLANDGQIYCAPDCADAVLLIDPAAKATSLVGGLSGRRWKWCGAALAGDGRVYFLPYNMRQSGVLGEGALVIDPASAVRGKKANLIIKALLDVEDNRAPGLVMAGDGVVYSAFAP